MCYYSVHTVVYYLCVCTEMYKILYLRNSRYICLLSFMLLLGMPANIQHSDVAAGLGYNTKQLPYMHSLSWDESGSINHNRTPRCSSEVSAAGKYINCKHACVHHYSLQ